MEHETDGDTNCDRHTQHSQQRVNKGTGGLKEIRAWGETIKQQHY